ncbi:hypothetical protein OCU04_001809 [Sclerotinia nivalis]|uniref:2EXR domain-containing protein n=1 Tax=Sclerotinia nivalis TaxID=352851 RepID=A0A9X0AYX1_9HELO|nr:hypothetical protein OCU04_001809 [Sclerotinia nivalis]
MTSYFQLLSDLQNTLDDITQPRYTSIRVVVRPRSQTLPANFAPSEYSLKSSPSLVASNAIDHEREVLNTKSDRVLRAIYLFGVLLNRFGLGSVRKLLVGLCRFENHDLDYLETINGNEKNSKLDLAENHLKEVDNESEFGLFEWFPTEVKLKILAYAFEAPRVVSVSCRQLKHNSSCHGHTRLVYSGPQNPHLYVNHLTRYQALHRLQNLIQYNTLHSGSKAFPTISYNPLSDTIWIREIDFWSSANEYSCSLTLPSRNRPVRSLAITTSSNEVIMDRDNLYRLSCILSHWFKGVRELIVIIDDLDFTTPGVRDEIASVSRKSKLLPKHCVVTKYSPAVSSLSSELIVGLLYGEWIPDHWHTLFSSLTHSLKSSLMKNQDAEQATSIPTEEISAAKLHSGLQDWKFRLAALNDNGEEGRRKMIESFRVWNIPTIKLLAAVTYKQLEEKDSI